MNDFVTVGTASEIGEGELKAFEVGGRTVAVARSGDSWYAFDDTCTHRQCSLADGDVEGTSVVCACHGSEFDMATGEVLNPPATVPIAVYRVRVEDDEIQVAT